MPNLLKYILILFGLFFLGFFVRRYKLDQVTPGYLGDEVPIAQSANHVYSFAYSPYYTDHPTFPLYIIGFFLRTFGRNLVSLRLSPVLFGSLTIPVFFLLCRRFFPTSISLLPSLLLTFSYSHLIGSRFANEVAPAVFFQTLSYLFLVLAVQKKSLSYLLALSVSLSLGLHTYITFRSQAAFITLFALILYPHKKHFLPFFLILFLITSPLIAYEIRHPGALWSRVRWISVFHQNLPPAAVIGEITASSFNIIRGFFSSGDPDPRQNPAHSALYDPVTVTLALVGLIILHRNSRRFFFLALLLGLPIFINDALTIEIIPDFRIPGQAHPNSFHLSGFIPLVHLAAGFTLLRLRSLRLQPHLVYSLLAALIFIVGFYNLTLYFNQPLQKYIYYYHNMRNQQITASLNNFSSVVYVSPSLIDSRITYFLTSSPTLLPLTDVATSPAFIDIRSQPALAKSSLDRPYSLISNPWGEPEILILPLP